MNVRYENQNLNLQNICAYEHSNLSTVSPTQTGRTPLLDISNGMQNEYNFIFNIIYSYDI